MEKTSVAIFSIGIVAEDKPRGTERCKIIPIETNFVNPTQVESVETLNEKQHASGDSMDNLQVTTGNAITAKWWKFNSNRVNPPDVKKEDYVLVLRLGKTDIYFWIDLNLANVKRLEDAVYAWSADPDNQMADDLSNAYVLNISPIDKHITLRTSMLNGEKAAFLFQFDNANGTWQCVDHKGNKFYMNSVEDDLGFENAMLSKISMKKEEIHMYSKKSINLETQTINETCTTKLTSAAKSATYKTPSWVMNGASGQFTGSLSVSKDFSYGGVGVGVGKFTVSESIIAGITFSKHFHVATGPAAPTTTPM